jgi:hypothetical protein
MSAASGPGLAIKRGATTVVLHVHLKNRRVVDEAIDCAEHHGRVGEDLVQRSEWLVRGDEHPARPARLVHL